MLSTILPPTKPRTFSFIKKNYLRVLDLVEKANQDHGLFRAEDRIVVGLSGGADSVSLISLLKRLERSRRIQVFAAHLDHGYHGKSKAHLEFCRQLCLKLSIPFYSKQISLPRLTKTHKRSPEEIGRLERYRFFGEVCRQTNAKLVATAHTLDDQAETVLMRLLRGTGFRGLVAIPWKRREKNFTVIRPLLYCEKKMLVGWLKSEKIKFCNDPTNTSEAFTRNFVRRTLIPLLEKRLNPQTKRALADYQSAFQDGFSFIESHALKLASKCVTRRRGSVFVRRKSGLSEHPVVVDEMLRIALSSIKGDYLSLSFQHIRPLRNLYLSKNREGKILHLPGGWLATRKREGLQIKASRAR